MAKGQTELVGRTAELATFATLIEQAADGQPTGIFVEGEAGIGKTRLLDEIADQVEARQGLVLRGDAPPTAGEPMPFAAIGRILRDLTRKLPAGERDRLIEWSLGLGHLQPAWRINATAAPPPTSASAMSEELLDVLDAAALARPLVAILVDDLQWADPATLDLLAYVARSTRESRTLVVLAARLEETASDAPIRRMRAELLRAGATPVPLGALGHEDVTRLIAGLADGVAATSRLREIAALGRGNPLFLRELVAATASQRPGTGAAGLPESLVALTHARLSRLSESEITVLQVVATVGERCTEDAVIRTLSQPEAATIADMRRLVDARMLVVAGDGSLAIGHPIMREVVLRDELDAQRRRICGAVARLIAADPGLLPGSETERLIRLATLWHEAGDRFRAFPALVRAAKAAERSFAFGTAFGLYAKALAIADVAAPAPERKIGFQAQAVDMSMADLRRGAADVAILAGEPRTAVDWLGPTADDGGDADARDRIAFTRARALLAMGDARGAVDTYRAALDGRQITRIPGPARVGFARALASAGDTGEAITVAESALVSAREGRSRSEEETALVVLGTALTRFGDLAAGMEFLHEARSLRQGAASQSAIRPRVSRVMDLTAGLVEASAAAHVAGLQDEAKLLSGDAEAAATRWGAEGEAARLRLRAAAAAMDAGRWDDSLAILDETAERPGTLVAALARRARIGALRGAWEPAAADLARCETVAIHSRPEDWAAYAMALTDLRGWRRQNDAAAASATEGLAMAREAPARDRLELVVLALRSHVDSALAARSMRSTPEAREHEEIARALAEQTDGFAVTGRPRMVALAATTRAEFERLGAAGGQAWMDARASWEYDGAVWWTGYASFREGEALLAGQGHRDAARDALVRGRSVARALEAAPLLAEIEALAVRGRVEFPSDPATVRRPTAERKLPISDRELEVLVLIARGLTNKEIAAELFISERTAAHHVGHIFDKLGVSSRVEAAGIAHQAGVLAD